MVTSPSFEQFRELGKTARVVPVTRALLADSLTPVVAKATLGDAPGTFLLESVVGGAVASGAGPPRSAAEPGGGQGACPVGGAGARSPRGSG